MEKKKESVIGANVKVGPFSAGINLGPLWKDKENHDDKKIEKRQESNKS